MPWSFSGRIQGVLAYAEDGEEMVCRWCFRLKIQIRPTCLERGIGHEGDQQMPLQSAC